MGLTPSNKTDSNRARLLPPTFSSWSPTKPPSRQIAVLMSGGVDSSVAAWALKRDGWDVLGITMKIPVACATDTRGCCGADAAFVCDELGLPHYFVDVTEAFTRLVVEPFRRSYSRGQTPNPCVDCNTDLKFTLVWDLLRETFGIDLLATGHYARVSHQHGRSYLQRGRDRDKDQSYFLYGIEAGRLQNFVLPLGDLTKRQVRALADEAGLTVAEKAESMELCFAGESDYRTALTENQGHTPGDITDAEGRKLGVHRGIANYTVGQRKGIGIATGQPMYVYRIDPVANTVTLAGREEMMTRVVDVEAVNMLVPEGVAVGRQVFGKIRSYGDPQPCEIRQCADDLLRVEFSEPQFAPCPGQKLVLYDERDHVLCGGTIRDG